MSSIIQKTVFISYRRAMPFQARAIYQDLTQNGYDVFIDVEGLDSGAIDKVILRQIEARAHFLIILTPTTLDRCDEPNDWLRLEIEHAMEHKRNIIPIMLDGFNFAAVKDKLTGKLNVLDRYIGINVYPDYFDPAMERLRDYLNKPIDTIIHPTPATDTPLIEQKNAEVTPVTASQVTAEQLVERATRAIKLKDYESAIADLSTAIKLQPRYFRAFWTRGYARHRSYDFSGAIEDYTTAIDLNPHDASTYRMRGNAYVDNLEYDQAIADFDKALGLNSRDVSSLIYRGLVWRTVNEYDKAINDFNEAIRIDPNDDYTYYSRGNTYFDMHNYEKAIADYDQLLRLDPNYAFGHTLKGHAYKNLNQLEKALESYSKAISIDSEPDYYSYRAGIYRGLGRITEAESDEREAQALETAVRRPPGSNNY